MARTSEWLFKAVMAFKRNINSIFFNGGIPIAAICVNPYIHAYKHTCMHNTNNVHLNCVQYHGMNGIGQCRCTTLIIFKSILQISQSEFYIVRK